MSGHWNAAELRDQFHDAIMKLVEAKAKAGDTETVEPLEQAPDAQDSNVVDLTELLRRSLGGGHKTASPGKPAAKAKRSASASAKAPAKHAAPRKRATTAAERTTAKTARTKRAA
jgi:DNA end-binding protein Ku